MSTHSSTWTTLLIPLLLLGAAQPPDAAVDPSQDLGGSLADTVQTEVDSLAADSLAGALEDSILFSASRFDLDVESNVLQLRREAWLQYGGYQLRADSVQVEIDRDLLTATQDAILEDGEGLLVGDRAVLDLLSEKGIVENGVTAMADGIYEGQTIRRVGKEHLDVDEGSFSTCRLEDPHYSFTSSSMRIEDDELAVARPLVARVRDVPVFYFPYFVLSLRKGRHSGLLVPSLENDSQAGRFFRGVGYYWAPNDHFDLLTRSDLYRTGRFRFESVARAAWRYKAPSSQLRWIQNHNPESGSESTDLRLSHSQSFEGGWRLRFDSNAGRTSRQGSSGLSLQRNWTGSLNLSKTFEGVGSAAATLRSNRNIETGRIIETLPTLTFRSQWISFFPETETEGPWPSPADSLDALEGPAWFRTLGVSYSGTATKERNLNAGNALSHVAIDHRATVSARGLKLLGGVAFAPSLVFQESWFDRRTDHITEETEMGWTARHTWQATASLSTTVQGLYRPSLGPLRAVMHSISPRVSAFYTPGFDHYFQVVDGSPRDRYSGLGSSSTPRERRSLSYSLSNGVQVKWIDAEGAEERIDLLSVQLSGSYDRTRDVRSDWPGTQRFSNLGLSGRLTPSKRFGVRASMPYDPYERERGTMTITLDARQSAEASDATDPEPVPDEEIAPVELTEREKLYASDPYASLTSSPWSISAHGTWTLPKGAPSTLRLNGGVGFNPTLKWRVDYRTSFNATTGERESQFLSVRRDLHCWTGSFSWRESSGVWSYFLVLRVKDLPDIKLENREFGFNE